MDKRVKQAKEMLKELEEPERNTLLKLVPSFYALGIMGIGIKVITNSLKKESLI